MKETQSHLTENFLLAGEPEIEGRPEDKLIEEAAARLKEMITSETPLSELYTAITHLYAAQLESDLEELMSDSSVSLAAKWTPTPGSALDQRTKLAFAIAKVLCPAEKYPNLSPENYKIRALMHLRQKVLKPLRTKIDIAERHMSENDWKGIEYGHVPSLCMNRNKKHFLSHDEERFNEYLASVEKGDAKIQSTAMLPHELIAQASDKVAQLQWNDYVEKLRKVGTLTGALAVCDVSGSMSGTPMEVAIALSILVSEVSDPPFKDVVCSFSATPQLHVIPQGSLDKKVSFVRRMDWGMNTNFQAVFDLILQKAVTAKLAPEKMIKTIFVFSDMEFDQACTGNFATDHQVIQLKFKNHGYEVPKIVYWNLRGRDTTSFPTMKDEEGVSMISGFSGQLLKVFLAGEDMPTPLQTMMKALEKYTGVEIVD